jgi:hypothetical protein
MLCDCLEHSAEAERDVLENRIDAEETKRCHEEVVPEEEEREEAKHHWDLT